MTAGWVAPPGTGPARGPGCHLYLLRRACRVAYDGGPNFAA